MRVNMRLVIQMLQADATVNDTEVTHSVRFRYCIRFIAKTMLLRFKEMS